jgi:hypothetical protein
MKRAHDLEEDLQKTVIGKAPRSFENVEKGVEKEEVDINQKGKQRVPGERSEYVVNN